MIIDEERKEAVRQALMDLYKVCEPEPPRGYPHLGLSIIDAVFSLYANYASVANVIDRYCSQVDELKSEGARFDGSIPEHTIGSLLAVVDPLSEEELLSLFGNRQLAPGTKIPKAMVVRNAAHALKDSGVIKRLDLKEANLCQVEKVVRMVPGIGVAAWRYLLNLAQIEEVKPDVMVARWIRGVTHDDSISYIEAADLLKTAALGLDRPSEHPVRTADHTVWRFESGRR